uniref:PDZ domain-containing protein n=1 Tax=Oryzias latipes TaxID=8090 RepID=A0A3B3HBV3_ORYLA
MLNFTRIKLTGGIGSKWQGIYCLEVVPGSPASEEGSVQPNDKILYISGRCTLGMTLEDAVKACEIAPRKVKLKVIRHVPFQVKRDTEPHLAPDGYRLAPVFGNTSVCEYLCGKVNGTVTLKRFGPLRRCAV